MQGLRPYVQDENALAGLHRPAAVKAGGGLAEGGLGAKALGKATPGFPGVRRALGNITNRGDAENALPGKTPAGAAPAPARRALGDITNAAAPSTSQRPLQHKAQAAPQPAMQPPVAAAAAAAAAAPSRADMLAEGGVERCFGRGWEQLEADRLAREDEESRRRLAALAAFPGRALPNFFPLWGGGITQQQALQKDVLPSLPASPMAPRRPRAGDLSLPDTSDLALPDLPCGDLDFSFGDEL